MGTVEATRGEQSSAAAEGKADALTITDKRTGRVYEVPITHGTIRAMDLRQIKTGPEDFGLMSYDPRS
jgi:citrate synthase